MGYEKVKGAEGNVEYEWKRLEIDNLPPDILTGPYEFLYEGEICNPNEPPTFFLDRALQNGVIYYYRRKEKPSQTITGIPVKCKIDSIEGTYLTFRIKDLYFNGQISGNMLGESWTLIPPEATD